MSEIPLPPSGSGSSPTRHAAFHHTRWSIVLAAQGKAPGDPCAALEVLCKQYWPPLYAYIRHRGYPAHDAQDLTQAFFARLLAAEWVVAADRDKGRFRSFLLMALKRFLSNEWDRSQTQKRGGRVEFLSLDAEVAETLYATGKLATMPAESLYERRWAITVLESVMARLRQEHEASGRGAEYELLKPWLTAEHGTVPYAQLAAELKVAPASARSGVHRLRKRFREVFREEIAGTVADPADVDDEIRAVVAALGQE